MRGHLSVLERLISSERGTSLAKVSGRTILGLFRFVKSEAFSGELPEVLAKLSGTSREVLWQPVRKSAWYDYRIYRELLEVLEETSPGAVRTCGAVTLRWDTASILKILRVFSSVDALVTRGFGSWGSFLWQRHCDAGRVFLMGHGPGTASMGLAEFPDISPHHCTLNLGYLEEMARAVGAWNIEVEHTRCVHRGDAVCEYLGRWGQAGVAGRAAAGGSGRS
jgi:hypothetical protein